MWTSLIEFRPRFVVPDWGELINLLPVFLIHRAWSGRC